MRSNLILILVFMLIPGQRSFSQSLAINTTGATASNTAILDISSSTKGILIPRMTTADRTGIASPATGLIVYDTDLNLFYYFDGTTWVALTAGSNAWSINGNGSTNPASNFLGTTDNNALVFRTNNTEKMRITSIGEVGIGTSTPNSTYGVARLELASEGVSAPIDLLLRNAVNSSGYAPGLIIQHARGTMASPLAVINGDFLGAPGYSMPYDGNSYLLSSAIMLWADGPVSTGKVPTKINFDTRDSLGSYNTRLVIKSYGWIGMGTINPTSTLQVSGTLAVDVSMNVAGGTAVGSPLVISSQKSYIGLSPTATNNYYQLPLAPTCPGRIYYIRNNDNSQQAFLVSVTGSLLCPGNSSCLSAGSTYPMSATGSSKTVMCVSDGVNWTVMLQN